jgi:uncharacterized protein
MSRILVSGSTGFVGSALVSFLRKAGHQVIGLVRHQKSLSEETIFWDPSRGKFDSQDFEGFDAVVHLAGKNIASGLWTKKVKEEIFTSRVRDSWLLSQILLKLKNPPKTFLCASAVGIYGSTQTPATEETSPGNGFLADVCVKWEGATKCVEGVGIRRVHTRFGVILSPEGGMLARTLPLFKKGLGAVVGSGEQVMPWVAREDAIRAIVHCLDTPPLEGPVNVVAPHPVTNKEFSQLLAQACHKPLFLRIPAFVLKLFLGEMADEVLLSSTNAVPNKLLQSGFSFNYSELKNFLENKID